MGRLIQKRLERLRLRLRTASALERGTRLLFYALLPVCGALVVGRLFSWVVPEWILLLLPSVMLSAGLLSGWMRRLTLHDCAVMVDREFDLQERVSSSLEAKGSFGSALVEDTGRILKAQNLSSMGRVKWPRETFLLLLSLPLAAFLWFSPSLEEEHRKDPELVAIAQEEVGRFLSYRDQARELGLQSEMDEVVALLRDPTAENLREAVRKMELLELTLENRRSSLDLSEREMDNLRSLAVALSEGGGGVARALQKRGVHSSEGSSLSLDLKKRITESGLGGGRHSSERPSPVILREGVVSGTLSPGEFREKVTQGFSRRDWPAKYDRAIRNYFSDDPEPSGSQRR